MSKPYQRDMRFYRFAQYATAFAFIKAMHEAGVDTEAMMDINWIANTEWSALLDEYEKTLVETPQNTREQLADLLFNDLMETFEEFGKGLDLGGDDGA